MSTPVAFGTLSFYETLAQNLNADPTWADKGGHLSFSIIYSYGPPQEGDFLLVFDSGKITTVREADDTDWASADYAISGSSDVWRAIINGETKPTMALATGKIKVKGDLKVLLKDMSAFQYLLAAMSDIPVQ